MSNETTQQPAQTAPAAAPATAPAPTPAPGGKPEVTLAKPMVDPGKLAKAAAVVLARQVARGEAPDADGAPAEAATAPVAPVEGASAQGATQEPAPRPELSRTDYWEHLDELQAQNRQLQSQLKRGALPENLDQLPVHERLQMVGVDPRDPMVLDALLDALSASGGTPAPAPATQAQPPEGTDPMVAQLLQQQQAIQARLEQFEAGNRTTQERMQAQQQAAAMKAEEAKFANVIQSAPGQWPVAERALQTGVIPLSFANEVAQSMMQQTGKPPTYAQVLTGINTYLLEEATKTANLLGEVQASTKPQPAAPAAPPQEESTTLGAATNEPSTRKLTRAERVQRAAALVKERQKGRK